MKLGGFIIFCLTITIGCQNNQSPPKEITPAKPSIDSTKISPVELEIPSKISDEISNSSMNRRQCSYENNTSTLGKGLLVPDSLSKGRLEIFNDKNLSDLFSEVRMYSEKPLEFCAKYQKPDYGILNLVFIDSTRNYLKILVNYSDIKYVASNPVGFKLISWEDYVRGAFSARRKSFYRTNFIYEIPSESSDTMNIPAHRFESFCVLDVWKDWIEVKYDCFYNRSYNPYELAPCDDFIDECELPSGWIRWKKGNELLVELPQIC